MPDIRYVVLSDLHFGAENSVLTAQFPHSVVVDPSRAGEVMTLLVECLHELISANEDTKRPTLVLGGDVLELALAEDNVAVMVFERFIELAFATNGRLFANEILFVPGNHDHHLWESARERHYAEYVESVPLDEPLQPPWHATRMLTRNDTAPVSAQLLTALVQRNPALRKVRVRTVYPNLGFVNEDRTRAVVYHHGHYVESMYRLVSTLNQMLFRRAEPSHVWEWEAQNFAWVDFFWSTLGRSGQAGKDVSVAYDLLQSEEAVRELVANLAVGLGQRVGGGSVRKKATTNAARLMLGEIAGHAAARERHHTDAVLSADAEAGLRKYVEGPVLLQLVTECDGAVPPQVAFLFGHTHKPFAVLRPFGGYGDLKVEVANTGGWVVDTLQPMPLHGAAAVLLDENLDTVLLKMYTQHDQDDDYRVTVDALPDAASHAFGRRISELVDNDRGPWKGFNAAIARTVRERNLDLATIIDRASTEARGPRPHRMHHREPRKPTG
jgi:hypothetical protein